MTRYVNALVMMLLATGASAQTRTTVVPGRLEVRGTGPAISGVASINSTHTLIIRNTNAGNAAGASIVLGTDAAASQLSLQVLGSTHASGPGFSLLSSNGSDALIVRTDNAESLLFGTNVVTRGGFSAAGNWWVGSGASDNYQSYQAGTFTPSTASTAAGYRLDTSIAAQVNQNAFGSVISPTIVEAGSGTHGILAAMIVNPPTITAGSAAVTTAATLYVNSAPSASGAANYALYVSAGQSALPDGTVGAPAMTFVSDPDLGIYRTAADTLGFAAGGELVFETANEASANRHEIRIPDSANGTGGVTGNLLRAGRNSSGNGAAGLLMLVDRTGTARHLWSDSSGIIRTNVFAPTEDGATTADTGGTVVGTQASQRRVKNVEGQIAPDVGGPLALDLISRTPVFAFTYKDGRYNGERFYGITTDDSPMFGMDGGKSFNPVTAFGATVLAIQELERRVRELEARR